MRIAEADILIVPGWRGSGPGHWQTRWEKRMGTARRVAQEERENPAVEAWSSRIAEAAGEARRPVVVVAHSAGVAAVVHAVAQGGLEGVAGAFLVAPADVEECTAVPAAIRALAPLPTDPLPFPSMLIASEDDPYCTPERAAFLASAWGSDFYSAGPAGHFDSESGHGPWPEGMMMFARFMQRLKAKGRAER